MDIVPENLKYTKTHEWVQKNTGGSVTVGITHHAQQLLGDMVFVELPSLDKEVKACDEVAVVESVKAASDIYSPLSGKIIAVNETLKNQPELINQSPYESGWIFKLLPSDNNELNSLLDAKTYQQQTSE